MRHVKCVLSIQSAAAESGLPLPVYTFNVGEGREAGMELADPSLMKIVSSVPLLMMSIALSLSLGCATTDDGAGAEDDVTSSSSEAREFSRKVCPTHGYDGSADTDAPNTLRGCDLADKNIPKYQKAAAQMYDLAPPFMQKMLITLDKLYIERDPDFKYDAWSYRLDGKNYMGFRSTIILKKVDFKVNFTSYDQQFFVGGRKDEIQPDLPQIVESTGIDSLAGTLVAAGGHELGHLIQYRDESIGPRWTRLSWKKSGTEVVPQNKQIAKMHASFCLRSSCPQEKKVARSEAEQSYRSLDASEFPSFFSMINPEEDLCEAMAYHVISKVARRIPFHLPGSDETIDVLVKSKKPRTAEERARFDFVQQLEDSVLQSWD
jgi:hypothetical protein